MIVLDTHVWVWWVHADAHLAANHHKMLDARIDDGLGVSIISCWEIAKLVEYGRLKLPHDVSHWLGNALETQGIKLLELSPAIVVESTQLPQPFHKDPADQMIVATARVYNCPLVTADDKILKYPHVQSIDVRS